MKYIFVGLLVKMLETDEDERATIDEIQADTWLQYASS